MERMGKATPDLATVLAEKLPAVLVRERIIPRFVDSYVVEHGRFALQVHAGLYRDLLTLLQREGLIALAVRTIEILNTEPGGKKSRVPLPFTRKEGAAFRKKFFVAMMRAQRWTAGDLLEFQGNVQLYEELVARSNPGRRARKPFEAANHPFVDRCGFLLDSSFMEQARLAASRALGEIETLATQIVQMAIEEPGEEGDEEAAEEIVQKKPAKKKKRPASRKKKTR